MNIHVATTLKKYYPCFVDGTNYMSAMIKKKYAGCNGKFFGMDMDEWLMFDVDTVDYIAPSFVVTFDQGTKVSHKQWTSILKWVKAIFNGIDDFDLNQEMFKLVPLPTILPEKISTVNQIEDGKEYSKEYEFRVYIDMGGPLKDMTNRALIEVIKPHTDKPYTAVIRNFEDRGYLPFFTALYICSSWGVCSHDHTFLEKVWQHLEMPVQYGALDLENRLRDNIERCTPREGYITEAEPEVYRKTIEEVLIQWYGKRDACEVEDRIQVKKIKVE